MRALRCLLWPHCWIEGRYIDEKGKSFITRECNECGELHMYANGGWVLVRSGS